VIDRFTPDERKDIGIHTCPGGDCDSTHSADVDYAELLPSMFRMNAGYFLIQLSSEKEKKRVYKLLGQHSRADANGVAQVCFIGVTNPQDPRVETPQEICDELLLASKYIPKGRLGSTDDCGFSPFSIDVKPKHGSPDVARDIAFQKIKSRVEGTRMASDRLGIARAA
jgi:methionine synthase II (cobalamin-independent)